MVKLQLFRCCRFVDFGRRSIHALPNCRLSKCFSSSGNKSDLQNWLVLRSEITCRNQQQVPCIDHYSQQQCGLADRLSYRVIFLKVTIGKFTGKQNLGFAFFALVGEGLSLLNASETRMALSKGSAIAVTLRFRESRQSGWCVPFFIEARAMM